jgi:hypothetical protein
MSEVGFMTMGQAGGAEAVQPIGVGMLGYAFMGKAHSNAYKTLAYMTWPPPLRPELVSIAGRDEDAVSEAAQRYGFAEHVTDCSGATPPSRTRPGSGSRPPASSTCAPSTTASCRRCGSRGR